MLSELLVPFLSVSPADETISQKVWAFEFKSGFIKTLTFTKPGFVQKLPCPKRLKTDNPKRKNIKKRCFIKQEFAMQLK